MTGTRSSTTLMECLKYFKGLVEYIKGIGDMPFHSKNKKSVNSTEQQLVASFFFLIVSWEPGPACKLKNPHLGTKTFFWVHGVGKYVRAVIVKHQPWKTVGYFQVCVRSKMGCCFHCY